MTDRYILSDDNFAERPLTFRAAIESIYRWYVEDGSFTPDVEGAWEATRDSVEEPAEASGLDGLESYIADLHQAAGWTEPHQWRLHVASQCAG